MKVVRENCIGQAIASENRSEKLEALTYPLAPMFVVVAGILIQAAEKRLPDAALDCMNDLNLTGIEILTTGLHVREQGCKMEPQFRAALEAHSL